MANKIFGGDESIFDNVFSFLIIATGGCQDFRIGMMSRLPILDAIEVSENAVKFHGDPIQLYGELTAVNEEKKIWILDRKILLFPTNSDLMRDVEKGQMIVVRGYLSKSNKPFAPYALKNAYYNPYNSAGRDEEITRLERERGNISE